MDFLFDDEGKKAWREWIRWFESVEKSIEDAFPRDKHDQWGILKKIDKIKANSKKIARASIKSMFEEISDEGAYSEPWEKVPWECSCESRMVEVLRAGWNEGAPSTMIFIVNLNDPESKERYLVEMGEFAGGDNSAFGMSCHQCGAFLGPEEEIRVINEVDV